MNSTDTPASPGCQYCEKLGPCNERAENELYQAIFCCEVGSSEWKATLNGKELSCDDLGESDYVKKIRVNTYNIFIF